MDSECMLSDMVAVLLQEHLKGRDHMGDVYMGG
jgi:hypothetical protein